MKSSARVAGIELGGTKAIAVVAEGREIVARHRIATAAPRETLGELADWLETQAPFAALGIASFGPLSLDPTSTDFGCIRTTSKPAWSGAKVLAPLAARFAVPVAIDTDVNAAALAEWRWGAGNGCDSLAYVTIGTGVGVGVVIDGWPLHGRLHPEAGHVQLARTPGDGFAGACRFHHDCIEGLISGPALAARFGEAPEAVAADDPRWMPAAHDLAQLLAMLVLTLSPRRIFIGGGVALGAPHLLEQAIARLPGLLGGYLPELDAAAIATIIGAPGLGEDAGPLGAIALAHQALEPKRG